ncbi:MAG: NAD(P)H-dependent oxidoreductase [bacterium]|nr:NAD(P)H-dependent oxidoreductase [bacterium]
MDNNFKIIGICGSLRKGSYNRIALEYVKKNIPENVDFEIIEIGNLPFFNQDIELNPPELVIQFREKIKNAQALIIASPEYNYSISSVLKNALEWGSRPYANSVLQRKPVAIMGVSTGMMGTVRAQFQLRQILVQINMLPLNRPEVFITFAKTKFDENGNIVDIHTQEKIKELTLALIDWSKKITTI